ncbi:uncharacterized protein [Drosophila kikkawai]|uniref:Uncharacterized protein n=1 Tax=Drosophila kikkawai TaxID=30033 RepID=A0A6P4I4R4_DROKI|nr:uncharacterized protein LOC108072299 [Drosophila kikkawai]
MSQANGTFLMGTTTPEPPLTLKMWGLLFIFGIIVLITLLCIVFMMLLVLFGCMKSFLCIRCRRCRGDKEET